MGEIPFVLRPVAGKGEMPPKAKEKGITMEEVRNRINTQKEQLQKDGKKY